MKSPEDLTRAELENIVTDLQIALYWDEDAQQWDAENECNGGDLVERASGLLEDAGLSP